MSIHIARLSHTALYVWMLGVALTLSGTVILGEGGNAAGVVYLGVFLMVTGLVVPLVHAFVENLTAVYREVMANRGEGQ